MLPNVRFVPKADIQDSKILYGSNERSKLSRTPLDRFFLEPNANAAERMLAHMKAKTIAIMIKQRRTKNE
ncbi:MAG: hypothetical protein KAH64_05030 [Nitrosomonadaceae bacterium]|nr:hypothetical protein [Nitrosomonadaceae bacterium]